MIELIDVPNPMYILFGMAMITCNLGGRFLHLDYTEEQITILSSPWFRPIYIISMAFMVTRNLIQSLYVMIFYYMLVFGTRSILSSQRNDLISPLTNKKI